jgi:transposase
VDLARVDGDEPRLAEVERALEKTAQGHDPGSLALLRTGPGVGTLLALVLRSAIEEIARVPRVPEFVSSGRLVQSARASHGKRHGPSGKTSANAHLNWAFAEAAGLLRKPNEPAQQYLAKPATRHGNGKALSLLAHTRGRAVYVMLKQHGAFDQAKCLAT